MASDSHRINYHRINYSRIGVVEPLFEAWKNQNLTVSVTRRSPSPSGTSDLYTQHPNVSWTETTIDIKVPILGPAAREDLDLGASGSLDGIVETADPLWYRDQIEYKGFRYEVFLPPVEKRGRYGGFLYRKCGLRRVELEEV